MFPEQFAEKWIKRLTSKGDTVLDPFSGRGTTALTALLVGRKAVASDTNDVAFCLTRAKTQPPAKADIVARLHVLERAYLKRGTLEEYAGPNQEFFEHAFSPPTLSQMLFLRRKLQWGNDAADSMLAALVLGSLHGDVGPRSPYLSAQMPRTISPKPKYSVRFWQEHGHIAPERDVFRLLEDRINYRYFSNVPSGQAFVLHGDMRELADHRTKFELAKCVLTSPPYLNVTSFEEDQWLRLWFLGREAVPRRNFKSPDDRHVLSWHYWTFMKDFWRTIGLVTERQAHVVIRIGSRSESPQEMKEGLRNSAKMSGRPIKLVSSRVSVLKKRQTDSFRPGTVGCRVELDCHFQFKE